MVARRIAGLAAGGILLASSVAAEERQFIVEGAFAGWEAITAAAIVDARCRSVRNPGKSEVSGCESGVADWLGLNGPILTIDAETLMSEHFSPEQRLAIVQNTDRLEARYRAKAAAREEALRLQLQAVLQARLRAEEHASAGLAPVVLTPAEAAKAARVQRRLEAQQRLQARMRQQQGEPANARASTSE